MIKPKNVISISLALLAVAAVLLASPVQARVETVKSIDIIYEKASGITSDMLSPQGTVTDLGTLTGDAAIPVILYSDKEISANLTCAVSAGAGSVVTALIPPLVTVAAKSQTTVSLQILVDALEITSPVKAQITVALTYQENSKTKTVNGIFTFTAANAPAAAPDTAMPYQFFDTSYCRYISEKKLLLGIYSLRNFSELTLTAAGKPFPAKTVYTTPDGIAHTLAGSTAITVEPSNQVYYLLIEFPTAYSAGIKAEAKIDTGQNYYSQTITPAQYSGTPTLNVTGYADAIILNGNNSRTLTLKEDNNFTDTDFSVNTPGAANLFYRLEKLTAGGWTSTNEMTLVIMPAQYESENVKFSDGSVTLTAVKDTTSAGTYRLIITQKFGEMKLSEFIIPVFTDFR